MVKQGSKITIDDLALMIARGFRSVDDRFEQLEQRVDAFEVKINNRVDELEYTLNKRIDDVGKRIDELESTTNQGFIQVDQRLARIDKRQEIYQRTFELHDLRLRNGEL